MPERYEIRIEGHLDPCWSEWLESLSITPLENEASLPRKGKRIARAWPLITHFHRAQGVREPIDRYIHKFSIRSSPILHTVWL